MPYDLECAICGKLEMSPVNHRNHICQECEQAYEENLRRPPTAKDFYDWNV